MLGKGVSREYFQPRPCSTGKNASKTGQAKRDLENIVYIDLDCDQFDDVEIIDCPDAVLEKLRGFSGPSKDRTSTPQSVISIDDDDDDDDESDDVDHSGIDVDGVGEFDSDASSNKRFSTPSSVRNSVHVDVEDCDVYEKDSVSKRQKSNEVFSSKAVRNRYGLYGSEIESSDSDCSDCEVIKREQWEKVSAKRKGRVFNERASSSGLHRNNHNNIEVENRSQRHGKGPLYGPSSSNYVKENRSSFAVKDDIQHGERTTKEKVYPCTKKNCNFCNGVTGSSGSKNESGDEESTRFKDDIQHGERTTKEKVSPCTKKNCNFSNGVTDSSGSKNESGDEESTRFKDDIQHGERTTREKVSACPNSENSNFKGHEFELHTQDADLTASNENNIINEKEKHKETDLYKKAEEEELASRQRALQIQAEEAQKMRTMRKRKKAENSRLLESQRRSKERLEDMRETEKKELELKNTKDKMRVEIKKRLNQLEKQCTDMTSLLRGLGINVGESLRPLPSEVHAAYKKAMLKFHPDRASKTDDIRKQVEAEETCKLLSSVKEKFCSTSWR